MLERPAAGCYSSQLILLADKGQHIKFFTGAASRGAVAISSSGPIAIFQNAPNSLAPSCHPVRAHARTDSFPQSIVATSTPSTVFSVFQLDASCGDQRDLMRISTRRQ
jgi:hypothetical protein